MTPVPNPKISAGKKPSAIAYLQTFIYSHQTPFFFTIFFQFNKSLYCKLNLVYSHIHTNTTFSYPHSFIICHYFLAATIHTDTLSSTTKVIYTNSAQQQQQQAWDKVCYINWVLPNKHYNLNILPPSTYNLIMCGNRAQYSNTLHTSSQGLAGRHYNTQQRPFNTSLLSSHSTLYRYHFPPSDERLAAAP